MFNAAISHSRSRTDACELRSASSVHDLSDYSSMLRDWQLRYVQLSRGCFRGNLCEAWIDGIQLYEEQLGQSVFQTGHARSGCFSLGVFSALSGEARWHGRTLTLNHITCLGREDEILMSTPQSSVFLGLSIPWDLLGSAADALPLGCIENGAVAVRLRQWLADTLHVAMHQTLSLASAHARKQFRSDVLGLLQHYLCACAGQNEAGMAPSKPVRVVKAAQELLHSRESELVTMEALCLHTHTSRRTLQNCFLQVTGESPAAFLKALRLNNVRQALFQEGRAAQVGEIASRWGFWHLSQFATDYKQMFGETPSRTLAAARH